MFMLLYCRIVVFFCLLYFLCLITFVTSVFLQYEPDEHVVLWVNKVGPYNNPQETYNYFSLPFCRPQGKVSHRWGGLGEVLGGNELVDSGIEIKFKSMYVYKMLLY